LKIENKINYCLINIGLLLRRFRKIAKSDH